MHQHIFALLLQIIYEIEKLLTGFKAAQSVTFDLLSFEKMFLFFKNTVKKTKIHVYILPIS